MEKKAYDKRAKSIPKANPRNPQPTTGFGQGRGHFIHEKAWLQQNNELGNKITRRMGRKITASLKEDWVE